MSDTHPSLVPNKTSSRLSFFFKIHFHPPPVNSAVNRWVDTLTQKKPNLLLIYLRDNVQ